MQKQATKDKKYNSARRSLPLYRRPWFLACSIVVIAAAVTGAFIYFNNSNNSQDAAAPTNNTNGSVPSSISPQGANAEAVNNKDLETAESQTPAQYEGTNPNTLNEITGFISYNAINYDHLSIRLTIDQYLASGTCELTMTSGGQTVTQTANIFADPSTSTCEGFDIPLSDLPSGQWNINVKITADGKTGTITGETSL